MEKMCSGLFAGHVTGLPCTWPLPVPLGHSSSGVLVQGQFYMALPSARCLSFLAGAEASLELQAQPAAVVCLLPSARTSQAAAPRAALHAFPTHRWFPIAPEMKAERAMCHARLARCDVPTGLPLCTLPGAAVPAIPPSDPGVSVADSPIPARRGSAPSCERLHVHYHCLVLC